MAVEVSPDRQALVAELRRLPVRASIVACAADPRLDNDWFTGRWSVAFWDEVLAAVEMAAAVPATRPGPDGVGTGPDAPDARSEAGPALDEDIPAVIFEPALAAYTDRWRADREDAELIADANELARAARRHLRMLWAPRP